MRRHPFITSFAVLASLCLGALTPVAADTVLPERCELSDVPYVQQKTYYCGPASLAMVMNYWMVGASQDEIGQNVYDSRIRGTNGAAMIIYARKRGLSSYSWTGSLPDLKSKLAAGIPVIVLQSMSTTDGSGHYRVATGFDDKTGTVEVQDPYDPNNKQMPYDQFCKLWRQKGNWCMLACSRERDTFVDDLDKHNSLVHVNLAYTYMEQGDTKSAEDECRAALKIEPDNCVARDILRRLPKHPDEQAKIQNASTTRSM